MREGESASLADTCESRELGSGTAPFDSGTAGGPGLLTSPYIQHLWDRGHVKITNAIICVRTTPKRLAIGEVRPDPMGTVRAPERSGRC